MQYTYVIYICNILERISPFWEQIYFIYIRAGYLATQFAIYNK